MNKTQKQKLLLDEFNQKNLNSKSQNFLSYNDKFAEIASSIAYYLKLFSSLKRFLEYVSLVTKYFIKQEFSLLIPLDEKGQIWSENICFSDKKLRNESISDLLAFCKSNGLFNKFKLKNINIFEKFLEEKFDSLNFKTHKIISRGKCRGFFYVFYKRYKKSLYTYL